MMTIVCFSIEGVPVLTSNPVLSVQGGWYSLKLIKDNYHNVIIVSSSQHLLRVKLTLEKELTKNNITNLNFYLVPSYATLVPKDAWYKESKAKEIIKGELERLIKYNLVK